MSQQPLVGQCLLKIEATRPHSVGLLWRSDQPDAENSTLNKQHSKEIDIPAPGGVRTRNPSKQTAANARLIPRGYWDRRCNMIHNDTVYVYGVHLLMKRKLCLLFSNLFQVVRS